MRYHVVYIESRRRCHWFVSSENYTVSPAGSNLLVSLWLREEDGYWKIEINNQVQTNFH